MASDQNGKCPIEALEGLGLNFVYKLASFGCIVPTNLRVCWGEGDLMRSTDPLMATDRHLAHWSSRKPYSDPVQVQSYMKTGLISTF